MLIDDFDIDANTEISIFTKPASNDVAPKRNQILEIDSNIHTTLSASIDTIAMGGSTGALDYSTTPRQDY